MTIQRILSKLFAGGSPGIATFGSRHYHLHNERRLEHLASLGLDFSHARVLEAGAGPGDHTHFYLERQCQVFAVDGRIECLTALKKRYPQVDVACIDMNYPEELAQPGPFDIVHCYGLLYHLHDPARAIAAMAAACSRFMVLETCVSPDANAGVNIVAEDSQEFTQAVSGQGCRPSRTWLFAELKSRFPHVYHTRTQPDHVEFPVDWTGLRPGRGLTRCVFVASRIPLDGIPTLSRELLDVQTGLRQWQAGSAAL